MDDLVKILEDLPPHVLTHVLKMTVEEWLELAGAQKKMPENGVIHENNVDVDAAAASGGMEVPEKGAGMEAARSLIHPSWHDDGVVNKHGDSAQIKTAQEGSVLIGQHHEGLCDGSSSLLLSPTVKENANYAAKEKAMSQKKRKEKWNDPEEIDGKALRQKKRKGRGKNWDDPKETDSLLKAVISRKQNNVGTTRMDKCSTASEINYWEAIAKEVPGRTGDECRMRMDTLKKSYSKIKKYCDDHHEIKEFKDLTEKMFQDMKLSPRLTEDWFHLIRDHCPPKEKKKLGNIGMGPSKSTLTVFVQPVAHVPQTSSDPMPMMDEDPTDPVLPGWLQIANLFWNVDGDAGIVDWTAPDLFPKMENQLPGDDITEQWDSIAVDLWN